MKIQSPYLFQIYQTRESVPQTLKVFLLTPFDPKLPVKCWIDEREDEQIQVDEDGYVEYRTFRKNANGNYDWDGTLKRPRFKRELIEKNFIHSLNIPPKDPTGRLQDVKALPEILPPVQVTPPFGYEWHLSLGITPTFLESVKKPVTLEDIYAKVSECLDEIKKRP